uniref:Sugar phosphate isomerase/epimerase n=1 Tax=Thermofilum pendens TaxID=2269 RepID=A0A7C4H8G6_THEPE
MIGPFKVSMVATPARAKFEAVVQETFARVVDLLKELQFDGVEVSVLEPEELLEAAKLARDRGLEIPAVGTGLNFLHYGLSLTHPDPGVREKALAKLKKLVDAASSAEAGGVIVGLIRGKGEEAPSLEKARELLHASLQDLCRYAALTGVKIFLEPLNRYESKLVNTVAEGLAVIEEVGCENLLLLLDTFHMNIEERVIEDSIRLAGGKIGHFHIADSNRLAPGLGHLDFAGILHALSDTGYAGYVSAEVVVKPDFETAARLTINTVRIAAVGLTVYLDHA